MSPNRAPLYGFLLVLPFIVLNVIVSLRVEPVYSFLGSISVISSTPWLPMFLLLLFPVAFFVTVRPVLHKDANGKHRFYILNSILGALILAATVLLWGGIGEDIIACDVLHIPNCD